MIDKLLPMGVRSPFSIFSLILIMLLLCPHFLLAGSVNLEWDPSTSSDITGYRIHYGTVAGNYSSMVEVGNVTSYTIDNLTDGETYYFVVSAFNSTQESSFSNEVSKLITSTVLQVPKITLLYPVSTRVYPTSSATIDLGGQVEDDIEITRVTWINNRGGSGTATGTNTWSVQGVALAENVNEILVTAYDQSGRSSSLRLTVIYSSTGYTVYQQADSEPFYLWLQAESGVVSLPQTIENSATASGGKSVKLTAALEEENVDVVSSGSLKLGFTVPRADLYTIWARVQNLQKSDLIFNMDLNELQLVTCKVIPTGSDLTDWVWIKLSDVVSQQYLFSLSSGSQRLSIAGVQGEGQLDRMLITSDANFIPSENNPDNVPPATVEGLRIKQVVVD